MEGSCQDDISLTPPAGGTAARGAAARSSTPVNVSEEVLLDADNISDISEGSDSAVSEIEVSHSEIDSLSDVELSDYQCAMSCPCSCCETGNCEGCKGCLCHSINYSYDLSFLHHSWTSYLVAAAATTPAETAAPDAAINAVTAATSTASDVAAVALPADVSASAATFPSASAATAVPVPSTMVWLPRRSYEEVVGHVPEADSDEDYEVVDHLPREE